MHIDLRRNRNRQVRYRIRRRPVACKACILRTCQRQRSENAGHAPNQKTLEGRRRFQHERTFVEEPDVPGGEVDSWKFRGKMESFPSEEKISLQELLFNATTPLVRNYMQTF